VKRLIIICQIFVVALFVIKISFLAELMGKTSVSSALSLDHLGQAIAQTPTKTVNAPVRDITDDGLQKERDLLALLQKKQTDLDVRENAVKSDEQRILILKKEVMDKIDALKSLETQLSVKLEADKVNVAKRIKDLAKVYESIPPPKAAAMLEKLDLKTAAGITIQMKKERAGAIWGFLSPQTATNITREITHSNSAGTE
jgi:flagellar motility protein MotE (MotC chaperone)